MSAPQPRPPADRPRRAREEEAHGSPVACAPRAAAPLPNLAALALDAAPARLELLDLAGRRMRARDVGALGGGSHVVELTDGRPIASGVYLLRLSRAGQSLTVRAAVVR